MSRAGERSRKPHGGFHRLLENSRLSGIDPIAAIPLNWQKASMKNIQIIDGAANATFSLFQATEDEFAAIFPDGREMILVEDVIALLGEDGAGRVLERLWGRPILKREVVGIHGTLFYESEHRREYLPVSGREVDWPSGSINPAQRALFAQHRE